MKKVTKRVISFILGIITFFSFITSNAYAATINKLNSECTDTYQDDRYSYIIVDGIRVLKLYSYGDIRAEYLYNEQGERISKNVNGKEYEYYYMDGRLVKEVVDSREVEYLYETIYDMQPYGVEFEGETYIYKKNEDGYIVGLLSAKNELVIQYILDENWIPDMNNVICKGNEYQKIYIELAELNSYIGLGYYFDKESNLYYNGRYYDAISGSYIGALYDDSVYERGQDGIALCTDYDLEAEEWSNDLLNSSTYGKNISYSQNWYQGLSTVEILARLIYGEDTHINCSEERDAVAWLLLYRLDSESMFGETGAGLRGIATKYEQFSTINPSTSKSENDRMLETQNAREPVVNIAWKQATYLACLLMLTTNKDDIYDTIGKPVYYTNQVYFLSYTTVYDDKRLNGAGDSLTMYTWGKTMAVKDVTIVGVGRYTNSADIYSNSISSSAYEIKNVYYNLR